MRARCAPILDAGGLAEVKIFASGGLDEARAAGVCPAKGRRSTATASAPASTTRPTRRRSTAPTSSQEYAGTPRRKRSEGKATWPGRKQVWRSREASGVIAGDTVGLVDEAVPGEALLVPVMRGGEISAPQPTLDAIRAHASGELARLPEPMRKLEAFDYPVAISPGLRRLADDCDGRGS